MKIELSEIAFVIVAGTLLFVFLIFIIIVFFVIYQKRKTKIELERIEERQKFEKEISEAQSEIREETMRFISQELHDNIAQTLTVTSLTLNRVETSNAIISDTQTALNHTIEQVRLLSKTLNTDNLLEDGFLKSLDFEIDRLKKLNRWNIDYFNDIQILKLPQESQLLLFRVFQELINNLIKYAQAENVVIEFEESNTHYKLSVIDDGNQYDFFENASEVGLNKGLGLKGIIKRVGLLKGTIHAQPNIKKGMTINLEIPK
jgi:signal transduction histidine kinase